MKLKGAGAGQSIMLAVSDKDVKQIIKNKLANDDIIIANRYNRFPRGKQLTKQEQDELTSQRIKREQEFIRSELQKKI